jgi:hypothetical protein
VRCKWERHGNFKLTEVCEVIKKFFKEKGFQISERPLKSGCGIVAFRNVESAPVAVVEAYSIKNEMIVDYYPLGEGKRSSFRFLSSILTFFGGGYFILRELKQRESMEELENEFWRVLDDFFAK